MAKKAAAKTVRLRRSGGTMWKVRIDARDVAFTGSSASRDVPPGEHTIQFFVRGVNLSPFSLEITSPPEAKLKFEGTFGPVQKDQGSGWFTIN
jgi:hypothetical protein